MKKSIIVLLLSAFSVTSFAQVVKLTDDKPAWIPGYLILDGSLYFRNGVAYTSLGDTLGYYARQSALEDTATAIRNSGISISLGTDGQVPFVNPAGTDLSYSSNFEWNDTSLTILSSLNTENIFSGYNIGGNITTANNDTYYGYEAGRNTTTGSDNTVVGRKAAISLTSGVQNNIYGSNAAPLLTTGNSNIMIGLSSGSGIVSGSGNIIFGRYVGASSTSSILAIDPSTTTDPLIYGDFANDSLRINGTLSTLNPKFYAAFADSSEVIACTQNVYSHLTGTAGELFTSYREEHGFTFQNDSVQIPSLSGYYEIKASISFQGSASDVWHIDFFVDNVEVSNRSSRERSTSNNAIGSCSIFVDYPFSGGEWVKIMVKNTGDNDDMTAVSCDWSIKYDEH